MEFGPLDTIGGNFNNVFVQIEFLELGNEGLVSCVLEVDDEVRAVVDCLDKGFGDRVFALIGRLIVHLDILLKPFSRVDKKIEAGLVTFVDKIPG